MAHLQKRIAENEQKSAAPANKKKQIRPAPSFAPEEKIPGRGLPRDEIERERERDLAYGLCWRST
jgi:hypothetical protein